MNKMIFLVVGLLSGVYLHGQVNSNGFVFRIDGNYNETTINSALSSVTGYNAKSKNGSVSISAGYLDRYWLFSLGFEYSHNKTDALGMLKVPTQTTTFLLSEQNIISLNSYGGVLGVNYFLPVWRNLYFSPGFHLGYGTIGGDNSNFIVSTSIPNTYDQFVVSEIDSRLYASTYESKISSSYFSMQLSPELTWFFSNHLGLTLQAGGFGIRVVDSDWCNSDKQINFNPSFWKLGIIFKI
jgi:hypothetical protein